MPSIFTVFAVQELSGYMSTCFDLKVACHTWLVAAGTGSQKAAADALVKELEEDILTIDQQIAHLDDEIAKGGPYTDQVKDYREAAIEAKKIGVTHCICPACTLGTKILANKKNLYE